MNNPTGNSTGNSTENPTENPYDAIVIGSGIGGLCAAAMLARYGKRVVVCESHSVAGGAAHEFVRDGFTFDSGPSFYCGLSDRTSLNPLRQVLDAIGESVEAIAYDPLGHYHFPDRTVPIYGNSERYRAELANITPQGAAEFANFERAMLRMYAGLRDVPTIALRADAWVIPLLLSRYAVGMLKLLPSVADVEKSVGRIADHYIRDPWVRRLLDIECFLLSGLKAHGTIAPEVAFMLGERDRSVIDYPIGGSGAIVDALVRGLERWGGVLRLRSPVEQITIANGRAVGVRLRSGESLNAPVVISNATLWDTYNHLLDPQDVPDREQKMVQTTPAIDSFMHLHLGLRAEGLDDLTGHHVVVHDPDRDITEPGNTCMVSIPTVWDRSLAPPGHHAVHAYTLEPFEPWENLDRHTDDYAQRKHDRAQSLYRALERIIPDLRDRLVLNLVGTPLTHARFLRRHRGTYGPGIPAEQGRFPQCQTSIPGLYRVGDSTMPGIGVPAVAASGILCANSLVSNAQVVAVLEAIGC
jgi:carotene isomerase